ncbi:MAG: hypothetical protein RLZZ437_475 [Pseudomonadota bacterium]|jgi:hypothetical protein
MDLFLGIDGSGPGDDAEYKTAFSDSFVKRYWDKGSFTRRGYLRGPGMMGSETRGLVNSGRAWILDSIADLNRHKTPYRLFLSGYSRGGAAVTEIAFELKGKGIKVHTMLLFDAVDQSVLSNVDVVPSNVKYCYHAMRNPAAGSREFFGNCATKAAAGVKFEKQTFWCTHGAMGGTPWTKAGRSGKIEEMSNTEKVGAMLGAGTIPVVGPLAQRKVHENDYTNVTLDQEKAAGPAIWKWMNEKLAISKMDVATS